jgi:sarcosine oxidase
MRQPDVIVVGLGAVGSALTWQLASRGVKVLGVDRFHPPHAHGSSHGRTRITRLAVGEGAAYVPLARRSHELWRELEAASGATLYRRTGALIIGGGSASTLHGQADFFSQTCELAERFGIEHERLDARAVRERFAAFAPSEGERAYFEPDGGLLHPEDIIRVELELAARAGAQLRTGERVLELTSHAGAEGVVVRTDRAVLHAARAVLCTGAWLPAQVGQEFAARLRVLRQVLHWFATDRPEHFEPARCPVFIWLHGPSAEDAFYGFPIADGIAGVKVATEQMRVSTEPDAVERAIAPAEVAAMHERHLRGRLPSLRAAAVHGATCLYTMAEDGRFIVDAHPRLGKRVTVVSACSGHGFKHSAALGEAIAQRLVGERGGVNLAAFACRR